MNNHKSREREFTIYGTASPRGKFANQNAMALLGQVASKRELIVYDTSRARGVNKNAMALLGQSRDSWPSIEPLDHVGLTKMQKLLESKNKNKSVNEKQNESKNENSFLFSFSFLFFRFCFSFSFLFFFYFFSFSF